MANKAVRNRNYLLISLAFILITGFFAMRYFNFPSLKGPLKPSEESLQAPGRDWPSDKKVEAYFIETIHMTPQEAAKVRSAPGSSDQITLRLTDKTTLDGLINNLAYYGFIRDKDAFRYALENTKDTVPGKADALKVGNNTIDIWSSYRISENMTAWEIADQLLNHPTYFAFDQYGYLFMP